MAAALVDGSWSVGAVPNPCRCETKNSRYFHLGVDIGGSASHVRILGSILWQGNEDDIRVYMRMQVGMNVNGGGMRLMQESTGGNVKRGSFRREDVCSFLKSKISLGKCLLHPAADINVRGRLYLSLGGLNCQCRVLGTYEAGANFHHPHNGLSNYMRPTSPPAVGSLTTAIAGKRPKVSDMSTCNYKK